MLNSKRPLVFTTEDPELKPWGETGVRMRLPVATGDDVLILRLDPLIPTCMPTRLACAWVSASRAQRTAG